MAHHIVEFQRVSNLSPQFNLSPLVNVENFQSPYNTIFVCVLNYCIMIDFSLLQMISIVKSV